MGHTKKVKVKSCGTQLSLDTFPLSTTFAHNFISFKETTSSRKRPHKVSTKLFYFRQEEEGLLFVVFRLSCLVLCCLVLSFLCCVVLSCVVLSCLALFALPRRVVSCLCLVAVVSFGCLILSCPVLLSCVALW